MNARRPAADNVEVMRPDDGRGFDARNVTPIPDDDYAILQKSAQERRRLREDLSVRLAIRADTIAREMSDGDRIEGDFLGLGARRTYHFMKVGKTMRLGLLTKSAFFVDTPELAVFTQGPELEEPAHRGVSLRFPTDEEWIWFAADLEMLIQSIVIESNKQASFLRNFDKEFD